MCSVKVPIITAVGVSEDEAGDIEQGRDRKVPREQVLSTFSWLCTSVAGSSCLQFLSLSPYIF